MPNRKNKVLFIFCILIVSMNVLAITHVVATTNNQIDGNTPSVVTEVAPAVEDSLMPFVPSAVDDVPNLDVWDLEINVTRVFMLHDYGYITINDTFSIIKQDNLTLPLFRFAYANDWKDSLVKISGSSMWDIEGLQRNTSVITEEYVTEDFTHYVMSLNPVIDNNTKYFISVEAAYLRPFETQKHFDSEGYIRNGVIFNASWIPLLTAPIKKCLSSFSSSANGGIWTTPEAVAWPINATLGASAVIYGDTWNVPAFNFSEDYDINEKLYPYRVRIGGWLGIEAPAEVISYKRTVIIDNWYYAKVHEEITIESFGARPAYGYDPLMAQTYATAALQRIHLYIDDAQNVEFSDHLGTLPAIDKSTPVAQLNRINAYLRIPLFGGDTATFNIDYHLLLEDILSFEGSEFILNALAMPKCEFHIR
ncbi:MAG: hypothetical protein ACTSP7_06735, partial [Candidatus Heimdallarchaeota archaeon]